MTRSRTITIAIALPVLSVLTAIVLLWNKPIAPAAPREIPAQQSPSPFETKQNNEGNVEVAVTPQAMISGKSVSFTVSLNTHSVPLEFELPAVSALTDDLGDTLGTATWDGTPPGGHHRNGTLAFPTPLPKQTKTVTLTFANIAGIATRTFTWEVTIQ